MKDHASLSRRAFLAVAAAMPMAARLAAAVGARIPVGLELYNSMLRDAVESQKSGTAVEVPAGRHPDPVDLLVLR